MASRQVALLRGINVGRAKRVAMADLRALVEDLGYRDVRTLLNSGNVIFDGPVRSTTAGRIEKAIESRLGVSARVTVLTALELATAVAENPLGKVANDPSRFLVAFLARPADRKHLVSLARQDWKPEALAVGKHVVYLWCADGILKSPAAEAVNRVLGDRVTARNWATTIKLHALAGEGPPRAPSRKG
jgi:uncharacterized protein (DUF1697 family)